MHKLRIDFVKHLTCLNFRRKKLIDPSKKLSYIGVKCIGCPIIMYQVGVKFYVSKQNKRTLRLFSNFDTIFNV